MSMIVVGLVADAHQARGLVRALEDGGFQLEDLDATAGGLTELLSRGVPEQEAHIYAEGARRGGMMVFVCTQDDDEAVEAAEIMSEHGVVDIDACASGWRQEGYAVVFGEYPAAPGRIYHDPRAARIASPNYDGPERREGEEPYPGVNRRAI